MNALTTNIFNKRHARGVMCVIIAAALMLGGARSLDTRRTAAIILYDNGQYTQGQGIPYDVDQCVAAYANMITVSKRYISENDADVTRLSGAISALNALSTANAMHDANEECYDAFLALHDRLGREALTSEDSQYRSALYDSAKSARNRLKLSPYNEAANAYNDARLSFPGVLYATVFFMQPLELFQ